MAKTIGQLAIDLLRKHYGRKSDVAREMLSMGYSSSEISNAVPMAYSQVHSIKKKLDSGEHITPQVVMGIDRHGKPAPKGTPKTSDWGSAATTPTRKTTKPVKSPIVEAIKKGKPVIMPKPRKGIGKLRTPGKPSDTDVGECANCGFDLVIRHTGQALAFIHVNISTEDYLAVTQFCHGVPKVLIA